MTVAFLKIGNLPFELKQNELPSGCIKNFFTGIGNTDSTQNFRTGLHSEVWIRKSKQRPNKLLV